MQETREEEEKRIAEYEKFLDGVEEEWGDVM
jgi:hypothetical protein